MSIDLKTNLHLEIAHFLFMDIVGYSKLRVDEQSELLRQRNQIVRGIEQFRAAGDGRQTCPTTRSCMRSIA